MKVANQYIIPFRGLDEGEHKFDFLIGKKFFEENSALNVEEGVLSAAVVLNRKSSFLELEFKLIGNIRLQCDRCLDDFDFFVDISNLLYVKFTDEMEDPDENVIFIQPSEDSLDLNQYFFDSIGLSIPIQKAHPIDENGESTCNEEMLNVLDAHSSEQEDNTNDSSIDPRWSKLKDLLKDENKKE